MGGRGSSSRLSRGGTAISVPGPKRGRGNGRPPKQPRTTTQAIGTNLPLFEQAQRNKQRNGNEPK